MIRGSTLFDRIIVFRHFVTRRALVFALFLCALVVVYIASRRHMPVEQLIAGEAGFRAWLSQNQLAGLGYGFAIYLGVSLIPGTTGKAIIVGWFYGFWWGLAIVNIGLTIAAILSFLISRYIARSFVKSHCGPRLTRVNSALEREGASYLFAARVLHAPYSVTNYVMGATQIRLRSFWVSTQLGVLPGNILYVYAGSQAPTLENIVEQGFASLLSPGLIAAFIAISVLPLFVHSLARRFLAHVRTSRPPNVA